MTKQELAQAATAATLQSVRDVIDAAAKGQYRVSTTYAAYNAAFVKTNAPSSCASCLIRMVRQLKVYMSDIQKEIAKGTEGISPEVIKFFAPKGENKFLTPEQVKEVKEIDLEKVQPAEMYRVRFLKLLDGSEVVLQPSAKDDTKGAVTYMDGTRIKPGTYVLAGKVEKLTVSVKGTGTIKPLNAEELAIAARMFLLNDGRVLEVDEEGNATVGGKRIEPGVCTGLGGEAYEITRGSKLKDYAE